MAESKSDYAEKAVLDWLLGGATPTRPSNRYVALFTATPSDTGGGTEVTGGSYSRQAATFGAATSSPPIQATTTAALTWTNMPSATVTSVGIYDASTGGNLLYYGNLTASKSLTAGDNFTINSGNLTVAEL